MLIAQISDLHVGGADVAALYRLDTRAALRTAIAQINALPVPPDVCLVTGDVVENGTLAEYRMAREELDALTMPWYAIPGNHDNHEGFRAGFDGTRTPAGDGAFIHYAVDDFPLRVLALDSVVRHRTHGTLCQARLDWLDARLAEDRRATLLMLHHPPFATGQPAIDGIGLSNRGEFAALVARHPHVEAIISGHVHRAIHGRIGHAPASSCPGTAHQMQLALRREDPVVFTHEPPGFQLHAWNGPGTWLTHTVQVGTFPGPFEFS